MAFCVGSELAREWHGFTGALLGAAKGEGACQQLKACRRYRPGGSLVSARNISGTPPRKCRRGHADGVAVTILQSRARNPRPRAAAAIDEVEQSAGDAQVAVTPPDSVRSFPKELPARGDRSAAFSTASHLRQGSDRRRWLPDRCRKSRLACTTSRRTNAVGHGRRNALPPAPTLVGKTVTDELAFSLEGRNVSLWRSDQSGLSGPPVRRFVERIGVAVAADWSISRSAPIPAVGARAGNFLGVFGFRPSHGASRSMAWCRSRRPTIPSDGSRAMPSCLMKSAWRCFPTEPLPPDHRAQLARDAFALADRPLAQELETKSP